MSALRPVLVVGRRDSGKTAYAKAVVERARAAGLRVAGVLSEAEREGGRKCRYYARDAGTSGDRLLLGAVEPAPSLDQGVGRFHMSGEAFASLNRRLVSALDADLICLDEVGPLEKGGGGFDPALRFLVAHFTGILLVTARPSVAPWLEERLGGGIMATGNTPQREFRVSRHRPFVNPATLPSDPAGRRGTVPGLSGRGAARKGE